MIRVTTACILAGLAILPVSVAAQQASEKWVQISVNRGVAVEADTGSVHARGTLRIIPVRLVAPDKSRMQVMNFAIDCKAHTLGIDGDSRTYEGGKLTATDTPPADAQAQQSPDGAPEFEKVIELACAAKL